jgi:hypothetical protein
VPRVGDHFVTVMTTESEAGMAKLARLAERQIPA